MTTDDKGFIFMMFIVVLIISCTIDYDLGKKVDTLTEIVNNNAITLAEVKANADSNKLTISSLNSTNALLFQSNGDLAGKVEGMEHLLKLISDDILIAIEGGARTSVSNTYHGVCGDI